MSHYFYLGSDKFSFHIQLGKVNLGNQIIFILNMHYKNKKLMIIERFILRNFCLIHLLVLDQVQVFVIKARLLKFIFDFLPNLDVFEGKFWIFSKVIYKGNLISLKILSYRVTQ